MEGDRDAWRERARIAQARVAELNAKVGRQGVGLVVEQERCLRLEAELAACQEDKWQGTCAGASMAQDIRQCQHELAACRAEAAAMPARIAESPEGLGQYTHTELLAWVAEQERHHAEHNRREGPVFRTAPWRTW